MLSAGVKPGYIEIRNGAFSWGSVQPHEDSGGLQEDSSNLTASKSDETYLKGKQRVAARVCVRKKRRRRSTVRSEAVRGGPGSEDRGFESCKDDDEVRDGGSKDKALLQARCSSKTLLSCLRVCYGWNLK
jgi:hypothetical protein